ncbi:RHS repeat-associated core domain-containing protein [Xanthomonas axonopodis pv. poinsettiicola]|uniref:RHS repeat-associated core domain-containing protein n=1 Tax=Xanthomonas TaxID=338 RepID=UPI002B4B9BEF|nr:RHS repeat-associated core domain-containing protein [Xanthomonas codiaei]
MTYQHTDALGSPVATTNAAGQVVERTQYEPYGAAIGKTVDGVGYTGHAMDGGTGLIYMQQRYYDASAGRFLSVDPVDADMSNGALFNRYMYAANNPYRFFDPDGRCTGSRIESNDGMCKSTGGLTIQAASARSSTVPAAPSTSYGSATSAPNQVSERTWFDRNIGERNWLTGTGSLTDFGAIAHDVGIPFLNSPQGGAFSAGFKFLPVPVGAAFNWARSGHIFRVAAGHANPATISSRMRFAQIFRAVASNPNYLRSDAVQAGIITQQAASAGVSAYTFTARNGQQIWVTVREGEIMNAGINAAGAVK